MYYCHIADTPSAAFLKRGSDQKKTKYTSHTAHGMLGSCPFLIGMTLTTLIDKIFLILYYIHTYLLFMSGTIRYCRFLSGTEQDRTLSIALMSNHVKGALCFVSSNGLFLVL